jgi:hypothetical protein
MYLSMHKIVAAIHQAAGHASGLPVEPEDIAIISQPNTVPPLQRAGSG